MLSTQGERCSVSRSGFPFSTLSFLSSSSNLSKVCTVEHTVSAVLKEIKWNDDSFRRWEYRESYSSKGKCWQMSTGDRGEVEGTGLEWEMVQPSYLYGTWNHFLEVLRNTWEIGKPSSVLSILVLGLCHLDMKKKAAPIMESLGTFGLLLVSEVCFL